jgi:hypothetical protein
MNKYGIYEKKREDSNSKRSQIDLIKD